LLNIFEIKLAVFNMARKKQIARKKKQVEVVSTPFVVVQTQGLREYMEDRYVALPGSSKKLAVYGVFDGHGGDGIANHCAEQLGHKIQSNSNEKNIPKNILESFSQVDSDYKACTTNDSTEGTTAVVVVLKGSELFVGHVGDSKAVLIKNDGSSASLTSDHKPDRSDEKQRIEAAGGDVSCQQGDVFRVNGVLAVSRALGDYYLKPFVCSTPEISNRQIFSDDAYLLLASDGLWDDVSASEAGSVVH
jgi:serine/threonine protein phosphatase PrpC